MASRARSVSDAAVTARKSVGPALLLVQTPSRSANAGATTTGALQEPGLLRGGHHVRADRRPAGRQLGQRGYLQVAEHGHGDRARDRRGRHHQHVRAALAGLAAQRVALLHAEPVLLVDHHQAQLGELDLLLEQRVGADDQPGRAGGGVQQGPPPRRRPQ